MTPLETSKISDRTLIESIVRNFYIVDYGYIHHINADGTIDVMHAKRQQTIDDVELPESVTKGMEVLTIGCKEFSIKFTLHTGDQVLLLGLKDYVKSCAAVTKPTSQDAFIHYARNTMKALPLSVFNDDAKVRIKIDGGSFEMFASQIKMSTGNASASKNAAREGDTVEVTIPMGTVLTAAMCGVTNVEPIKLTGTIKDGSKHVFIGD